MCLAFFFSLLQPVSHFDHIDHYHYTLIPSSYASAASTHQASFEISDTIIFCIMRSKQLNPGKSETFAKIEHIRNSQFFSQHLRKSFYLSLITILSILVSSSFAFWYQTYCNSGDLTWGLSSLSHRYLSSLLFSLYLFNFFQNYLVHEASLTTQIGFRLLLSVHSACVLVCLCHNVIFLGVGRDWDCTTCTFSTWHKASV